jgi:single-strand DNA-binding protein
MFNATNVTVVGHIVDAPQLRSAGDAGTPVTTFRVVTTSRRYDKRLRDWVDADTLFLRVNCWRDLAENAAVSLGKGDPVIVHGRLAQREYEADGRRHRSLDIDAAAVGPDLCKATVVFTKNLGAEVAATPEPPRVTNAAEGATDGAADRAAEPAMAPV